MPMLLAALKLAGLFISGIATLLAALKHQYGDIAPDGSKSLNRWGKLYAALIVGGLLLTVSAAMVEGFVKSHDRDAAKIAARLANPVSTACFDTWFELAGDNKCVAAMKAAFEDDISRAPKIPAIRNAIVQYTLPNARDAKIDDQGPDLRPFRETLLEFGYTRVEITIEKPHDASFSLKGEPISAHADLVYFPHSKKLYVHYFVDPISAANFDSAYGVVGISDIPDASVLLTIWSYARIDGPNSCLGQLVPRVLTIALNKKRATITDFSTPPGSLSFQSHLPSQFQDGHAIGAVTLYGLDGP